ncbi:MAG: nickel-dependent hydrogenase large subunit [Patescibacteria group bacterium]|nr:nickel-dependent hydrogenase large subunit [Patescibacteria group bacterium]MBU2509197.1 nickel-dependent hydrogenase large subunit [Patescibacteria group bacterium]
MHQVDLSLTEITKVEGSASLDIKVDNGKVEKCQFSIKEFKRFYTQAMRGKAYASLPQLLARICGTCSNAHLMCSIESCENALGIEPTPQSQILKELTMSGLMIRDHALHLYLFSLPDIYKLDAFLKFDESDPEQHQLLHDAFDIKAAGNYLATIVAGRSVHAIYPTIGGFIKVPNAAESAEAIKKMKAVRPAVLRLIKIFEKCDFKLDVQALPTALVSDPFGFLHGVIKGGKNNVIKKEDYPNHLDHVVLPYSQASAYKHQGEAFMVGALPRINLSKQSLHKQTQKDAASALKLFPSKNIYHNNLAQAIEILHCIDSSIEILKNTKFKKEPLVKPTRKSGTGIGVVEAPRGTLYHKVEIGEDGKVIKGEIVVPTGQNQISIELDLRKKLEELIPGDATKEDIAFEMEKLIRAYDPCMSCAAHFLKVNWL